MCTYTTSSCITLKYPRIGFNPKNLKCVSCSAALALRPGTVVHTPSFSFHSSFRHSALVAHATLKPNSNTHGRQACKRGYGGSCLKNNKYGTCFISTQPAKRTWTHAVCCSANLSQGEGFNEEEKQKGVTKPLDTFANHFNDYKEKLTFLKRELVATVQLERYSDAADVKNQIEDLIEEFPEEFRERLRRGKGVCVSQPIRHVKYGYRGVVFKCDPTCEADEMWCDVMGVNKLANGGGQPFYHVLCHNEDRAGDQTTYVAEDNIVADDTAFPISHALLNSLFTEVPELNTYLPSDKLEQMIEHDKQASVDSNRVF